jgi:hypothetical protein
MLIAGLLTSEASKAYEVATHSRLTYAALLQSQAYTTPEFVLGLGLPRGWATELGDTYIDSQRGVDEMRSNFDFDFRNDKLPGVDVNGVNVRIYRTRPHGWLMVGAVREDDASWGTQFLNTKIFSAESEPHDDPWGDFNRFCNHFFDPFRNRSFTDSCSSSSTVVAPVWATGQTGPFTVPFLTEADEARRNHFTIVDAREFMWQALTGKNKNGTIVAVEEYARLRRWASTFRALGDVLHLNQDMAQPQHTRDEGHGAGHSAWYEKYIDGRAKGQSRVVYEWPLGRLSAENLQPLSYAGYPTPAFSTFGEFWSTWLGNATMTGRGLADYSSRGFFTPAKNFGSTEFPMPSSDAASYTEVVITRNGQFRDVYLDAPVLDAQLAQSSRPIHMTHASILDQSLLNVAVGQGGSGTSIYTLDRATFDDRAELLIPRAVAYSAGLLDHFFRGRLSLEPPEEGVYAMVDHAIEKARDVEGFSTIRVKVSNGTPGEPMTRGVLVAVVKYHWDNCYADDLSGLPETGESALQCRSSVEQIAVSDPIDLPGGLATSPMQYTFHFPSKIAINSTDVLLQVVYRGALGTEADAVAVGAKDLSEPTYFAFHNATDFSRIGEHVYSRAEINADPGLLAQVSPQTCVDYTINPPQLKPSCLLPLSVNMVLGAGTGQQTATISGLPPRRFSRIAMLAEGSTTTLTQSASTCLPASPFVFNNLRWQVEADPYTGAQVLGYSLYQAVRGIKGWFQVACVLSGDGSLEGDDDRMTRLDAVSERYPHPAQISPL